MRCFKGRSRAETPGVEVMSPTINSAIHMQTPEDRKAKIRASFAHQANAIMRKNAKQQLRSWKTNACLIGCAIIFPVMLLLIQSAINNAISGNNDNGKCGCLCTQCCNESNDNDCYDPRNSSSPLCKTDYECKTRDESQCGLQYSNARQSEFCAQPNPSSWPPVFRVPSPELRAQPWGPDAAIPYTAQDLNVADQLAQRMFTNTTKELDSNDPLVNAALEQFRAHAQNGTIYGELFTLLGYTIGANLSLGISYFLDPAFVQNANDYESPATYSMMNNCAAASAVESTQQRNNMLQQFQNNQTQRSSLRVSFTCVNATVVQQPDITAINNMLFCGFKDSDVYDSSCPTEVQQYTQAYDFANTSTDTFTMNMWYNDSNLPYTGGPPLDFQRVTAGVSAGVDAWVKWVLGDDYSNQLLALVSFPKVANELNIDFSSILGPIFYTWLLSLVLPIITYNLVYEKANRLRVMMEVHGLGDVAYWTIQYAYYFLLYAAFMVLLVLFGWVANLAFFRDTALGFQVVFYFIWGNNMIATGFLFSTWFMSPKTASAVTFIYVFAGGLLGSVLLDYYIGRDMWWLYIVELVPIFALYRGLYEVSQRAFLARDAGFDYFGQNFSNMTFGGVGAVWVILAVEWIIFMVLAVYLDQVLRSSGKPRKHWLFCLPGWSKRSARRHNSEIGEHYGVDMEGEEVAAERKRVEELGNAYSSKCIVVKNIRKVFPRRGKNPPKVAVRDVALAIDRGECFGLLGPNGAGKTTLLSMLTGFIEPSGGSVHIEGCDISTDLRSIYSLMGVCPQHDLLWEDLTAREHLRFYGRLKNLHGQELESAVTSTLKAVNLFNGKVGDKVAGKYSGGMKRRLSVGISLIGGPLVMYLDEPSTGLDPASRRTLWEAVKAVKSQCGMILTTHSMEEAAVLCDRLGIFVDGQLVVLGNPKELANKYGGYLVFTITTNKCDEQRASKLVLRLCSDAKRTYSLNGTQKYELSRDSVTLSQVFQAVEAARNDFTIIDWGISNATLEEVFIKISRDIGAQGGT